MKLVAVSGIQGSGKTTLIRDLASRLSVCGHKCGVIVNEDGEVRYDNEFANAHGLIVDTLRGG